MAPIEPCQSTKMPLVLILAPSLARPVEPSTCMIVFIASIGIRKTRNPAAAAEAVTVLAAAGAFLVTSYESQMASMPAFAAVSPCEAREATSSHPVSTQELQLRALAVRHRLCHLRSARAGH